MRRVLRIALFWLIALAIPAQGVAAVSMLFCGPTHHRLAPAAHPASSHSHEQPGAHDDHAVMGDHAAGAHNHGSTDHGQPADVPTGDAADQRVFAGDLDQLTMHKCGACASCCAVSVLPSAVVTFEAADTEAVHSALPTFADATFLTGGLDRPPRSFLA